MKAPFKIRILPVTTAVLVIAMFARIPSTLNNGKALFISDSYAEESKSANEEKSAGKEEKKEGDGHGGDKKKEAKSDEPETVVVQPAPDPNAPLTVNSQGCGKFSQTQIDLLQSLSKRRDELEKKASSIDEKEILLNAAETKIANKMAELEVLKASIEKILAEYNTRESEKIKSLVKIYENMKPAAAAEVFEKLEMPILLQVVDKMNEKKLSPIVAALSPEKAKSLTVEFANQKKLPDVSALKDGASDKPASPAPETVAPLPKGGSQAEKSN